MALPFAVEPPPKTALPKQAAHFSTGDAMIKTSKADS
jgi:hypothetical protein